jgi:DNA-binding NarL/FixJ family response regulator
MPQQSIRVLIVDDHEILRRGFMLLFKTATDLIMVGEAANGQEAVDRCAELQPDIILMDLLMPVMDGVTATRLIRERHPHMKVLLLTFSEDAELIQSALNVGANGYLNKQASVDEIVNRLRSVAGNS